MLTRAPQLLPNLEQLRDLSLIHAHFGPEGVYAMAISEHLNIPFCVTFHGYDITLNRRQFHYQRPLYYQLLRYEKQLQEKAAAFIAVSGFIRQQLLAAGYPEHKIIQHYIGVDVDKFCPGSREPNERYILCVGRHTEKKGIDILLRAFAQITAQHPDVLLVQVGQGELTNRLKALTQTLGLEEKVRFLGAQPHGHVLELIQEAEIFALPSHTASDGNCEALGIVFNEASACGIPVVSTRHGGIPEAIVDGQTGFLVPEQNISELAKKLHLLLSNRPLGEKMGRSGRELVCQSFNIHKQATILEQIYDQSSKSLSQS